MKRALPVVLVLFGVLLIALGQPWLRVTVALGVCYVLLRIGVAVIGSFARPVPAAPPPGELRKVRIRFRCSICGTEVRMVSANDEVPEPPRHCMEDMEFVAPVME